MSFLTLTSLGMLLVAENSAATFKPGELVELDAEIDKEEGIESNASPYLDPGGAVCVAYVDKDSPNHRIMKKLAVMAGDGKKHKSDDALRALQLPLLAAVGWTNPGNESLMITYRKPFHQLWEMNEEEAIDITDAIFPSKVGAAWKQLEVKEWLLANGFPLINVRVMDGKSRFLDGKYFGPGNTGGVALAVANLTGDKELTTQFQVMKMLRPYAERYKGKLRFSFVERTKHTRDLRMKFSVGVDSRFDTELLVIDDVNWRPQGLSELNHNHGLPKKYRLQNLTQSSVDIFFTEYEKGTLNQYWSSQEAWTWRQSKPPKNLRGYAERLVGPTYENFVFDRDPQRARLVAFFDNETVGCKICAESWMLWEKAAKKVNERKRLRDMVALAAIDQSLNEHPEQLVPGRIAQPIVVWYPRGTRSEREKGRKRVYNLEKKAWLSSDEMTLVEEIEELVDEDQNTEL